MLTKRELKWLRERKHNLHWSGVYSNTCLKGSWKLFLAPDYKDAAEFEAQVTKELLYIDYDDLPCAAGEYDFCPLRNTRDFDTAQSGECGNWCRLRISRIWAEQKMSELGQ